MWVLGGRLRGSWPEADRRPSVSPMRFLSDPGGTCQRFQKAAGAGGTMLKRRGFMGLPVFGK